MSKVHMKLDGQWATCHATTRACPRMFHLDNFTPKQVAEQLPKEMLMQLLEAIDPPTWQDDLGNKRWEDAEGKLHRDHDLPAVAYENDGLYEWYQHGQQHRAGDKPAYIDGNGNMQWYWEDELHREDDKPAEVYSDGMQGWYQHGERHRGGGKPAVIFSDGSGSYWVNGEVAPNPNLA